MTRLDEIKARLAAVTTNPLTLPLSTRSGRQMVFVTGEFGTYNICDSAGEMDAPIAEFVADAPADIEWLLAELAKYEECVDGFCTDGSGNVCFENGKHYSWARGDKTRKVYLKEGE